MKIHVAHTCMNQQSSSRNLDLKKKKKCKFKKTHSFMLHTKKTQKMQKPNKYSTLFMPPIIPYICTSIHICCYLAVQN